MLIICSFLLFFISEVKLNLRVLFWCRLKCDLRLNFSFNRGIRFWLSLIMFRCVLLFSSFLVRVFWFGLIFSRC